jgi:hypothetical protein
MATESPLLHDGGQTTLSTAADARRSSITGTTLNGPNGSAQFYPVVLSTTVARTVALASTAPGTTPTQIYGVLQNTPGPGQAADVGFLGVSKVIAGSTSITFGSLISPSSTIPGTFGTWATGQVYLPSGVSLENPTSTGAVITAMLFNGRMGGSS